MPALAPTALSSSCPATTDAADTATALDKAAFGEAAFGGPNANNGNGANGSIPATVDTTALSTALSVEQRRWLLLRAIELMDKREQSALQQWRHYRCPGPATLIAPAREDGRNPVYRLDHREQRCSCPDQAFCDAFNARCQAAGLPAWAARLCCKHHRIAQLLSTWRSEFGPVSTTTQAPPPSCCAAQEEPQGYVPPAQGFQEKP